MKTEIKDRKDIEFLIDSFYEKVKKDAEIGFFFNEIAHVNWEEHLPVLYSFWEGILFGTGNYRGNTIQKHIELHQKSKMVGKHFERWMQLFTETIDEHFAGNIAMIAKQRALSISTVIQIKIANSNSIT